LVANADALILDEAAPRALSPWGLREEDLRGLQPALSVVSLPPFATGGPWSEWRGTELILSAASGSASFTV
jgi:crotonobetainyl-CoA:carnitine CoA-transferase CaiB-like acyl-CoA transferase